MRLIIGIIAEKGAGKGLFVKIAQKLLPQYKISSVRYSDIPREILTVLGKEESRENMQIISTALRRAFNEDGIFNMTIKKRLQNTDADLIILDGVRKREEAEMVKELNGLLVYIKADPQIRFARRKKDVENTDEEEMSWEQFQKQDLDDTEISIKEIGEKMANAVIENNGTMEEFENKIQSSLENKVISMLNK